VEAERLDLDLKEKEKDMKRLQASEDDLRTQLRRTEKERTTYRERSVQLSDDLERIEREFKKAEDRWEAERRQLTQGVRFANMSVSQHGDEASALVRAAELDREELSQRHTKELRGLAMQIEWLRARCRREEMLRSDAAFAKRFVLMQVELYGACNQADLALLAQMGITPDRTVMPKPPTIKKAGLVVIAMLRMKRGAAQWAKSRRIHERIVGKLEGMRRGSSQAGPPQMKQLTAGTSNSRKVGASSSRRSLEVALGRSVSDDKRENRRVSELRLSEGRRISSGR
jgi:hypothetical protein